MHLRLYWKLPFFYIFVILFFFGSFYSFAQEKKNNPQLLRAESEFQRGNWDSAFSIYKKLATVDPNYLAAQLGMASCLVEKRRYPSAISTFLRAIEISPDHPQIQAALASTYFKNKQSKEAVKWYQNAIDSSTSRAQLSWYLNLGTIEADLGNTERARQIYNLTVQLYPQSVPSYYNLGIILLRQNRLDEADACFYAALELNPDFDPALFGRGEVATKKHDFMLAEEFYRASIQLNPRKASYTYAYAQNLLRQGKSEEGKRQLKQARRLKAEKHSRQAHEWAERKNWQEVCRNLQLAVEVDPTFLNAIEELAYVHAELGNLNQAKSTLSIGLLNVPNWAPGYWERGKIKQRTQEIEGAKLDFQKAIILSPEAIPPKISMAKLLLKTETDLPTALQLVQAAIELDPLPEYQQILRLIEEKLDSPK